MIRQIKLALAIFLITGIALIGSAMVQQPASPILSLHVLPLLPPSKYSDTVVAFDVRVQNTGDVDVPVRLGTILGNGGKSYLEAVVLILTDVGGNSTEIVEFKPEAFGGPMFDWAIPLRPKETNSFMMSLNRCWIPTTKQLPPLTLKAGIYQVRAEFRRFRLLSG